MNRRLQRGFFCLAFLLLLDVCLFGALCNITEGKIANADTDNLPPIVALTFDDGPNTKYTKRLLDGLKERNVKATFFLIGRNIEGNEDLVLRMSEEGHIIGNHTYNHVNLMDKYIQEDCEEIKKTNEKIFEITGKVPVYMRPPFGVRCEDLECIINMEAIMWDVDTKDWLTQNKNQIVRNVLKSVRDNDVVLFHDVYDTSVDAVLEVIDNLKANGWEFVTVDELMP